MLYYRILYYVIVLCYCIILHNIILFYYVIPQTWKRYKSLWSASIAQLYSKLGTKLKQWMTTLHGIR